MSSARAKMHLKQTTKSCIECQHNCWKICSYDKYSDGWWIVQSSQANGSWKDILQKWSCMYCQSHDPAVVCSPSGMSSSNTSSVEVDDDRAFLLRLLSTLAALASEAVAFCPIVSSTFFSHFSSFSLNCIAAIAVLKMHKNAVFGQMMIQACMQKQDKSYAIGPVTRQEECVYLLSFFCHFFSFLSNAFAIACIIFLLGFDIPRLFSWQQWIICRG